MLQLRMSTCEETRTHSVYPIHELHYNIYVYLTSMYRHFDMSEIILLRRSMEMHTVYRYRVNDRPTGVTLSVHSAFNRSLADYNAWTQTGRTSLATYTVAS
ncbi:hypothetical protein EVAR_60109_1 [Eumeta japonica]|uniref:Uncharacterized protein n=1 Tax=Eumeta variegata TaxID=151549 RepID=A0A4C1Z5S5_EUMVA|nr:hypothetical protein EVAR_60109_1 [Eumeta japonica]